MRRAAKILLTGIAALLLLLVAVIVVGLPMRDPSLVNRAVLAGLVAGIVLPLAALAVLPWLAVPDASPRGKHFLVAMPRLALRTFGILVFISVSLMLLLPAIAITVGAIGDAFRHQGLWLVAIGSVFLPGLVLLLPTCAWLLYRSVIQPWRWRRWPLLTVAADGLHIPGRPLIDWPSLAGTTIEINDYQTRALIIAGPETVQSLWLGPQPKVKIAISLATLAGPARAVASAINNHPHFRRG